MNTNRRNFMQLLGASGLGFGTALNLNASTTKDEENNGNDDRSNPSSARHSGGARWTGGFLIRIRT